MMPGDKINKISEIDEIDPEKLIPKGLFDETDEMDEQRFLPMSLIDAINKPEMASQNTQDAAQALTPSSELRSSAYSGSEGYSTSPKTFLVSNPGCSIDGWPSTQPNAPYPIAAQSSPHYYAEAPLYAPYPIIAQSYPPHPYEAPHHYQRAPLHPSCSFEAPLSPVAAQSYPDYPVAAQSYPHYPVAAPPYSVVAPLSPAAASPYPVAAPTSPAALFNRPRSAVAQHHHPEQGANTGGNNHTHTEMPSIGAATGSGRQEDCKAKQTQFKEPTKPKAKRHQLKGANDPRVEPTCDPASPPSDLQEDCKAKQAQFKNPAKTKPKRRQLKGAKHSRVAEKEQPTCDPASPPVSPYQEYKALVEFTNKTPDERNRSGPKTTSKIKRPSLLFATATRAKADEEPSIDLIISYE